MTFCLLGAALPSDLIRDVRTTPFNVGKRIELRDFTLEEARAFTPVLGANGAERLERVFFWTGGHPFLTQTLCAGLTSPESSQNGPLSTVDEHVRERYLDARARETDTNLADVGNRLLGTGDPNVDERIRADALSQYTKLLQGSIQDDESNPSAARIKMSGVASLESGRLSIRNRIYAKVFDKTWIRENMPGQEFRRQKRAFWKGAMRTGGIAAAVVGTISFLAWQNQRLANTREHERNQARYEAYASAMSNMSTLWDRRNHEEIRRTLDRFVSSPDRGWEWDFWNGRISESRSVFEPDGSPMPRVSPDGKLLVYRIGQWAKLLDASTLRLVRKFRIPGHGFNIWWTPKGTLIEEDLEGRGRDLELDPFRGGVIRDFGHRFLSWHPDSFSPDGLWTFEVGVQGETSFFDLATGNGRRIPAARLTTLGFFLPDGKTVVLYVPRYKGGQQFSVAFIDRATGQEVAKPIGGNAAVGTIAASRDGRYLAVATDSNSIRVYDLPHRRLINDLTTKERVGMLQFSTDGTRLVAACANRLALLYAVDSHWVHPLGEISSTNVVWFVPGTHRLVASYGLIRLIEEGEVTRKTVRGLPPGPFATGWRGDLAIGIYQRGAENSVLAFDPKTERPPQRVDRASGHSVMSEDGTLVIGDGNQRILRDPISQKSRLQIPSALAGVSAIVSSDRKYAAVREVGKIATWDISRRRLLREDTGGDFTAMAFSPDGRHLALGRYDGRLEMRRTVDLTVEWSQPAHFMLINHLEFSRDGRIVSSSSDDDTGAVLDARNGQPISHLVGHGQTVFCTVASPDLRRAATCGDDGTVRLWDFQTGRELTTLETKVDVKQLHYSADGRSLYGIARDGRVYTWTAAKRVR
ncbi:WD40 repeat domain-containing protein [Fimbriimonas ginsengisoli]|uniref:WD-40 repeat protein n=1 Tax=Fimbriimonas ginsengisoli Gsoil 348 TaxID=661478 RepID=A0A068NRS4_FIMGI|nr:WD40 repeat domain-containing protein [Fimbriimonas ginsengisoli]AIE86037.1 WD-40 repeat protein [Fimbriimonas ginsengisoli Gsoil 348]